MPFFHSVATGSTGMTTLRSQDLMAYRSCSRFAACERVLVRISKWIMKTAKGCGVLRVCFRLTGPRPVAQPRLRSRGTSGLGVTRRVSLAGAVHSAWRPSAWNLCRRTCLSRLTMRVRVTRRNPRLQDPTATATSYKADTTDLRMQLSVQAHEIKERAAALEAATQQATRWTVKRQTLMTGPRREPPAADWKASRDSARPRVARRGG